MLHVYLTEIDLELHIPGSDSLIRIGPITSSNACFCVMKSCVVASDVESIHSVFSLQVLVVTF